MNITLYKRQLILRNLRIRLCNKVKLFWNIGKSTISSKIQSIIIANLFEIYSVACKWGIFSEILMK